MDDRMKKNNMFQRTLSVFISFLFLLQITGCFSKHPDYPGSWPPLKKEIDIEESIEGSYSCHGENINSNMGLQGYSSLSCYLVGGKEAPSCDFVKINKPQEDSLELQFTKHGKVILRKLLKENKDYTVKDGWISFNGKISSEAEDIVIAWGHDQPSLALSTTGDLIVKSTVTTFGLVCVVIPVTATGTDWGLFKRLGDTEIKK